MSFDPVAHLRKYISDKQPNMLSAFPLMASTVSDSETGETFTILTSWNLPLTRQEALDMVGVIYDALPAFNIAEDREQMLRAESSSPPPRAVKPPRRPKRGTVYVFAFGDGRYKVGMTVNRLALRKATLEQGYGRDLETVRAFSVTDVCRAEKAAHRAADDVRLGNAEIFMLTDEHFAAIDLAVSPYLEETAVVVKYGH